MNDIFDSNLGTRLQRQLDICLRFQAGQANGMFPLQKSYDDSGITEEGNTSNKAVV